MYDTMRERERESYTSIRVYILINMYNCIVRPRRILSLRHTRNPAYHKVAPKRRDLINNFERKIKITKRKQRLCNLNPYRSVLSL